MPPQKNAIKDTTSGTPRPAPRIVADSDPQASTTKPPQASTAKPGQASTTKPAQASTTKPAQASTTKPAQASTTKPAQASTTKPPQASTTKPPQASTKPAQASTATAQASMPNKNGLYCVFFYGTLMLPEVFYSACYGTKNVPEEIKKRHTFRPAILHGYCRRRVEGANYPGIAPDANKNVLGVFATGITEANMKRLDDFEGDEYARKMVTVNVFNKVGNANGKGNAEGFKKTAVVYEFLPGTDDLVQGEWNLEDVRVQILQDFVRG